MAEEENKEENKESENNENSGGNNKLLLIVVVVLLLLLLVIAGVVAYFLLTDTNEPQPQQQQQQTQQEVKKKKINPEDTQIGPMYPLDKFIVNLQSDGARRYLKCTMDLEMSSPELQQELDKKVPLIRDVIIRILSSKTVEMISTAKGKEKLKEEIVRKLNQYLESGEIKHVYFTDFVIQ